MAKTPTDKTFKGIFEEYPEYASDEYIWNKDLDKYTQKEIDALDAEIIDIAYNSGVAFLEQINQSIKTYLTRISLSIAYLLVLSTGLAIELLKTGYSDITHSFETIIFVLSSIQAVVYVLLLGYCVLMILLFRLLTSKVIASTHFTPKQFLTKEMMRYDPKLIKIYICRTLQVSAEKNLGLLRELSQKFKLYVTIFVAISLLGIAGVLLLSL